MFTLQRAPGISIFSVILREREFSEFGKLRESNESLRHELGQFKDPVSDMCLAGAMVAFWSLTQDVAGSNPFTVMTNIFRH